MQLQVNGCIQCLLAFASGYVGHNVRDFYDDFDSYFLFALYFKILKKPSSAVQLRTELASLKEELQKISITVRKTAPEATTQFTVSLVC